MARDAQPRFSLEHAILRLAAIDFPQVAAPPPPSRALPLRSTQHTSAPAFCAAAVWACARAAPARREAATALRSAHDWLWQGLPAYVAGAEFWVGEADAMADLPFHQDKDEALASRGIARCPRLGRRPRAALA